MVEAVSRAFERNFPMKYVAWKMLQHLLEVQEAKKTLEVTGAIFVTRIIWRGAVCPCSTEGRRLIPMTGINSHTW